MAEPESDGAGTSRVAVVGAGAMGAQIAYQAALHGYQTTLCGRDLDRVEGSAQAALKVLQRRVDKGKLGADELATTMARVQLSCDLAGLARADIIIESVAEDRAVKRDVLRRIGDHARDTAIIGTNSSTLPSSFFADAVAHPERLLNIHFYNPALVMPLVEVVRGPHTAGSTVEAGVEFARRIGKQPVLVERESYGFLANRMLFMAMREAFVLVENGYTSMEDCDEAVRGGLGWPMGPFALADLIGLDVTEAILSEGAAQTGEDRWAPPSILSRRVAAGRLGNKSGGGFYSSG